MWKEIKRSCGFSNIHSTLSDLCSTFIGPLLLMQEGYLVICEKLTSPRAGREWSINKYRKIRKQKKCDKSEWMNTRYRCRWNWCVYWMMWVAVHVRSVDYRLLMLMVMKKEAGSGLKWCIVSFPKLKPRDLCRVSHALSRGRGRVDKRERAVVEDLRRVSRFFFLLSFLFLTLSFFSTSLLHITVSISPNHSLIRHPQDTCHCQCLSRCVVFPRVGETALSWRYWNKSGARPCSKFTRETCFPTSAKD